MYIKRSPVQREVGERLEKTSGLILKISLHPFLWHLTSSRGSFVLSNDLLAIVAATASGCKQDSAVSRIIITGSLTRLTGFTVAFPRPLNSGGVRGLPVQRLPQLQVVGVEESGLFAQLPVGSIGQPHLSASLVHVFPGGIKGAIKAF